MKLICLKPCFVLISARYRTHAKLLPPTCFRWLANQNRNLVVVLTGLASSDLASISASLEAEPIENMPMGL